MLALRPNRVRLFLAVEVTALLLIGASVAPVARAAVPPPAWAALGDSYTSGPLIPNQITDPPGCLRSDHDYPHLAAAALGFSLSDVSCSGATVADMTRVQSTVGGPNPPQLSAVAPNDRVVTVSIGGNDIDFRGIIENCIAASPWGPTRVGTTCRAYYDRSGHDVIAAEIRALRPRTSIMLARIHAVAPNAAVFLIGYPSILPAEGSGCWPRVPLTAKDVPYLRLKELQLNGMLASVAAAHRVIFVNTYVPSEPHNACTAESVRWIEPIVPHAMAFPIHPNAAGEAGMAKLVEGAVGSTWRSTGGSSPPAVARFLRRWFRARRRRGPAWPAPPRADRPQPRIWLVRRGSRPATRRGDGR